MAKNFFKIKNGLTLPGLSTAPSSPVKGDIYFNNVDQKLYAHDGFTFVEVGGSAAPTVTDIDAMHKEVSIVTASDKILSFSKTLPSFLKNSFASTGNMNTAREEAGSAGTQNASLTFGGYNGGNLSSTEKYNGATWIASANMNFAKLGAFGNGIQNSAIAAGGFIGGATANVELFNGTSWTTGTGMNSVRFEPGQPGNRSTLLVAGGSSGGYGGPYLSSAEFYNGSTWSNLSASLATTAYAPMFSGRSTSGLIINGSNNTSNNYPSNNVQSYNGSTFNTVSSNSVIRTWGSAAGVLNATVIICGYTGAGGNTNVVEKFNGINWYSAATFPTSQASSASTGSQDVALTSGGNAGSGTLHNTYKFIGEIPYNVYYVFKGADTEFVESSDPILMITNAGDLSLDISFNPYASNSNQEYLDLVELQKLDPADGVWTASGSLNTARYYISGTGSQNAAVSVGGYIGSSAGLTTTEKFNGTSWSSSGALNSSKYSATASGIQNAALSFNGFGGSYLNVAEKFNGSTWASTGNTGDSKMDAAGAGTMNSSLSIGGTSGSASANCEKFNGTSWSYTGSLNIARYSLGGVGSQNAALSIGGYTGSNSAICEKFNGSAWSYVNSLSTAKYGLAASGSLNSALIFAGTTGSVIAISEKFNGVFWMIVSNVNTARLGLGGAGSQSSAVSFGGFTASASAVTEKYNTQITVPYTGAILGKVTY